jgi:hypothetical protein
MLNFIGFLFFFNKYLIDLFIVTIAFPFWDLGLNLKKKEFLKPKIWNINNYI